MFETPSHLPDTDRLSVMAAAVMLAYAVTPFIQSPEQSFQVQLPGFLLNLNFSLRGAVTVVAAALAGLGADWMTRSHPRYSATAGESRPWLLPALTAWVIGQPLNHLEVGAQWWAVFAFGGLLLAAVSVAEYVAVDPSDTRHSVAAVGLNAVAHALFLILAISLRGAAPRLYVILPALVVAAFLTASRSLYLRLSGQWLWKWPLAIAVIVGQLATALHYWPVTPIQYGLALMGCAYALTSLAANHQEGRPLRSYLLEPVAMLAVTVILALFIPW